MKNSRLTYIAKRRRWVLPLALVFLAVSGWRPGYEVAPTSPAFEQSLVDSGLRPLRESQVAELLGRATVYGIYVLTEQRWIEYFDGSGVVVRTRVASGSAAARMGRPLLFGSWWGQGDDICFAYGLSRFAECYRLYYRDGSMLYVQATPSRQVPAGALLAYSTEIRTGNVENFPLIGD